MQHVTVLSMEKDTSKAFVDSVKLSNICSSSKEHCDLRQPDRTEHFAALVCGGTAAGQDLLHYSF